MRTRHIQAINLLMNLNFQNPYVIDSLHDDRKVEVPLSVCFWIINPWGIKWMHVADYVVSRGIDVLLLTQKRLRTGTDKFTINTGSVGYEFNHCPRKSGRRVMVLSYFTNLHLVPRWVSQRQRRCISIFKPWTVLEIQVRLQ